MKEKDEEKMVRLGLAAVFVHGQLAARQLDNRLPGNLDRTVDTALELADELIRKTK